MKKLFIILLSFALTVGALALSACDVTQYIDNDIISSLIQKGGQGDQDDSGGDVSQKGHAEGEHVFGEWETVTAPTCESKGSERRLCSVCGWEETRDVEMLAHTYAETWSRSETEHWHAATCEHTELKAGVAVHTPGDWIIDTEPTYDTVGAKHKSCTVCGAIVAEEEISKRSHDEITFKTLTVNADDTVFGKVPNTQMTFSFIKEVSVSGNATFIVSTDIYGMNQIPTKTVPLSVGDNTFYVLETVGSDITLYTVTVRRKPIYTVTFNANGGTAVVSQQIEEDALATTPTEDPTRTGYTFAGWDFDFTVPITNHTTVKAKWTANTYAVTLNANGGACDKDSLTVTYDAPYTLPTPTRTGYTFAGWFVGNTQYGLTSWTVANNTTVLTAKWNANGNTPYVVKHYRQNIENDEYTLFETKNYTGTSDASVTLPLMTYTGFTAPASQTTTVTSDGSLVIEYYYTRNVYTLFYTDTAGKCEDTTLTLKYGQSFTLPTLSRAGYDFLGWFENNDQYESGTWTTLKNVSLTAKWQARTDTAYTVKHYQQNIENDEYTLFETKNYTGTSDASVTLPLMTYTGFTAPASQTTTVTPDGSLVIEYYYTRNVYTLFYTDTAGKCEDTTLTLKYGQSFTLPTLTRVGYDFLGFYESTTKYESGTWTTLKNVSLTAKWTPISYTITYHLDGGTQTGNPATYTVESETFALRAPTKSGYHSVSWYTDGTYENACQTVNKGTVGNLDFYAKWEAHTAGSDCKCTVCGEISHTAGSDCKCTVCGVAVHTYEDGVCVRCGKTEAEAPDINGNKVTFGSYPQSKVTDSTLISTLNAKAGTLPTATNSQNFTSYGYYINGSVQNFMWYIDLTEGDDKYRGVYFTSYRPYLTTYSSSSSNSNQDDNGYTTGTLYWFKYEPLTWTILSQEDGKALILCDFIIDSQQYDYDGSYSNNYAESTIRKWLNDEFLNIAFDTAQIEQYILTTTVDNSARSTNPNNNATQWNSGTNTYACGNTEDKVFLLSEQEVTNSAYGFAASYSTYDTARQKKNTDYAKAQGVWTSTSDDYAGNGYWWLRSPDYSSSNYARGVSYVGGGAGRDGGVDGALDGVVPALQISVK